MKKKLHTFTDDVGSISGSSASTEPMLSSDQSFNSSSSGDLDWIADYIIPWDKFPGDLLQNCRDGKQPPSSSRRQMVKIIVDDVLQKTSRPKRKNMDTLAHNVVAKYPKSFQDNVSGVVIGSGHSSLTNQLCNKVDKVD